MRPPGKAPIGAATVLLVTLALLAAPPPAGAQGCAQCRDNVRATPPATQHAYRQAIALLAGTALAVCSAAIVAMRHGSR